MNICRSTLNSPVVYATEAVVLVLFLFCMALYFYYAAFYVESYIAPCSHVFNPV